MCERISNYLTHKKILCEQQCGFINGLLSDMSVSKLLKQVHNGFDANKFGVCDFLELRKATDVVNKDILLSKLITCSIRGLPNHLLRIYLQNRQQFITINNTNSSNSPIGMGVP